MKKPSAFGMSPTMILFFIIFVIIAGVITGCDRELVTYYYPIPSYYDDTAYEVVDIVDVHYVPYDPFFYSEIHYYDDCPYDLLYCKQIKK